jgi:hypothetical protein
MPQQLTSGELIANISSELADNNAGLISAYDVRHNMEDMAFSINKIVSSGDHDVQYPFYNPVRASKEKGDGYGIFIAESGISFPFSPVNPSELQTEPWLGEARINHNNLDNLTIGDPHTQYYILDGTRALEGNMSTDSFWINKSGVPDVGFKFEQLNADATQQEIYVSGTMRWVNDDNSILENAKGVAKAWAYFDASGIYDGVDNSPVIKAYHNIESIERIAQGKLKITFASGTFESNSYAAFGHANATTSAASEEDFSVNTVGLVLKEGNEGPDDGVTKRTLTYVIKNENGDYVDSELCELVVFGYSPNETSGTPPTMIALS